MPGTAPVATPRAFEQRVIALPLRRKITFGAKGPGDALSGGGAWLASPGPNPFPPTPSHRRRFSTPSKQYGHHAQRRPLLRHRGARGLLSPHAHSITSSWPSRLAHRRPTFDSVAATQSNAINRNHRRIPRGQFAKLNWLANAGQRPPEPRSRKHKTQSNTLRPLPEPRSPNPVAGVTTPAFIRPNRYF